MTPLSFLGRRLYLSLGRKRPSLSWHPKAGHPGGRAKLDRRTKNLVRRLRCGDVAIINHPDLDSVAARALADCKPSFVINAAQSTTGRYPNAGPAVLLSAGIPILDSVGEQVFSAVKEGDWVWLEGNRVMRDGAPVAEGRLLTQDEVRAAMDRAKRNLSDELRKFAENTLQHIAIEAASLIEPAALPDLRTRISGRHVLVIVRGEGYRSDLHQIMPYIEEVRPVLLAVDGGADALLECRLKPHIILGDMDSVSDKALTCGAELVVHAYPDGRAPGLERVRQMGLTASVFPVPGTSEDAAMLLAYEKGAEVIVALGTHFSLMEFLDKGRAGMASTFLVRLRVGSILVDAKGVSRLYRPGVRWKHLAVLSAAALVPMGIIVALSPTLNTVWRLVLMHLRFLFWKLWPW
ncbi:MAG: putative cytokinetic ring protein SteA [Armatimonadota bacterium]